MTKAQEEAKKIKEAASKGGWSIAVRGDILTISKRVNNREEFCTADREYGFILRLLRRSSPGSDWGTDGSGIGGALIVDGGLFVMNRSGGNKRVLSALAKMI